MHHERRNMNENNSNDLQTIITQVIEEMKSEQGHKFDLNKINLPCGDYKRMESR